MNNADSNNVKLNFGIEDILNQVIVKDIFVLIIAALLIYLFIKFFLQFSQNQLYSIRFKDFAQHNSYILQFLIWAIGLSMTIWLFIDYSINSSLLFNLFIILAFIFLGVNLLRNIYSGFLTYINKTFKIGDTIQFENKTGIVKRIGIRSVHIHTTDQSDIIIPHSRIMDQTISVISDKVESANVDFTIEIAELDSIESLKKIRYACYASPYLDYTKPVDVFVDKVDTHDDETIIRIKAYVFNTKYSSALKSDIIKNSSLYFKQNRKTNNEKN